MEQEWLRHTGSIWSSGFFPCSQVPLSEVVEPVDFEEYLMIHLPDVEPGPLRDLFEFPDDDLDVIRKPRECLTLEYGFPVKE